MVTAPDHGESNAYPTVRASQIRPFQEYILPIANVFRKNTDLCVRAGR
jgi:hypothetical protein